MSFGTEERTKNLTERLESKNFEGYRFSKEAKFASRQYDIRIPFSSNIISYYSVLNLSNCNLKNSYIEDGLPRDEDTRFSGQPDALLLNGADLRDTTWLENIGPKLSDPYMLNTRVVTYDDSTIFPEGFSPESNKFFIKVNSEDNETSTIINEVLKRRKNFDAVPNTARVKAIGFGLAFVALFMALGLTILF